MKIQLLKSYALTSCFILDGDKNHQRLIISYLVCYVKPFFYFFNKYKLTDSYNNVNVFTFQIM